MRCGRGAHRSGDAHRSGAVDRLAPRSSLEREIGGSMNGLDGDLALVSGRTRGSGRAIADELARHGAKVVGTATTEEGAKKIDGRVLNVTDPAQCDALIKELGDVAILVNNAGITRDNL